MSGVHFTKFAIAFFTSAAIVFAGATNKTTFARGGGGHGGGHGGHHGGGHSHHPYHPSSHHTTHHEHHDDHHHYHHHHHSWHHGGWGPGFWGGLGLGALGGWYGGNYWGGGNGGYYGGDTYVDNSSSSTPADANSQNPANITPSAENAASPSTEGSTSTQQGQADNGFPVDDWPELGVVTYAGEYGKKQGIVVVRVVPNSAAAKAGIVPGDVILRLNDHPTANADELETELGSAKGKFDATVWDARTGRTSNLSGTLDAAPADLGGTQDPAPSVAR